MAEIPYRFMSAVDYPDEGALTPPIKKIPPTKRRNSSLSRKKVRHAINTRRATLMRDREAGHQLCLPEEPTRMGEWTLQREEMKFLQGNRIACTALFSVSVILWFIKFVFFFCIPRCSHSRICHVASRSKVFFCGEGGGRHLLHLFLGPSWSSGSDKMGGAAFLSPDVGNLYDISSDSSTTYVVFVCMYSRVHY